ncbi:unnamed protein product [Rhodiola kirilowii]
MKGSDALAYGSVKHLPFYLRKAMHSKTFVCSVKQDAEESFKKTVEVDMFIDTLRHANPAEKDYEELAASLMTLVDRIVHQTKEKIETATDVLKAILKPVGAEEEELIWPPTDPKAIDLMEKEILLREQEGQLDEGFLAEVNAQLRQAKEDGDKPGLEAMLQKVLQLYAARALSKRSYAKKGQQVLKAEQFLESIIKAPEEAWNKLLLEGLTIGKGDVTPEELKEALINREFCQSISKAFNREQNPWSKSFRARYNNHTLQIPRRSVTFHQALLKNNET